MRPSIENSMTACDLPMAPSWPAKSAALSLAAVMSVAYFTTLNGLPLRSRIGLYEASIQISLPPLPMRLYWPESNSPRLSFSQNARYSALIACVPSANMLWCWPLISGSA